MSMNLYSTWRNWRRDISVERAATVAGRQAPFYDAITRLGVGLAGIACGGETPVSRAK